MTACKIDHLDLMDYYPLSNMAHAFQSMAFRQRKAIPKWLS